jgi:hypothetical protein
MSSTSWFLTTMMILKRYINNVRDGFHHNSTYWQNIRKALPMLPPQLMEIAIAMVLSDASLSRTSNDAHMKIEQGYLQKDFVYHLFDLFKQYCFALDPQAYIVKKGPRNGLVKSYWFKTFSHPSFSLIWDLFYTNGVKTISPGLVQNHINALGLAYWIMSDGSLQNDLQSMILHTQSFTKVENELLSTELNAKFGLHSRVIPHKGVYWVIFIPREDAVLLHELIAPHMIPYFSYKVPVMKS